MSVGGLTPERTLALLLGASRFPRAPRLSQGRAFYNSAEDFGEYLQDPHGLGLRRENVSWLFDDSRSPSDQLLEIGNFLHERSDQLASQGTAPQDLIVYYVGHGLFAGSDQLYCLAIRGTDENNEGLTSIRASDLASVIKNRARFLRKFLILDCCFSAAAYGEFQSGPLQAARVKLLNELPQRGTVLLCSSSAQDPSLAPQGLPRTMFSDALVRALREGNTFLGPRMSMSELGDLVRTNLREAYPRNWVRPELHSPDQREGDVADVPVFPNPSYVAQPREEVERTRHEEAGARRPQAEGEGKAREQGAKRETSAVEQKAREVEDARRRAEPEVQEQASGRESPQRKQKTRQAVAAQRLASDLEFYREMARRVKLKAGLGTPKQEPANEKAIVVIIRVGLIITVIISVLVSLLRWACLP